MTPIERRRAFHLPGYKTLADVCFDGPFVTPYLMASACPDGPVLVAYHWLDVPSFYQYEDILREHGYLPGMLFNKVIDRALSKATLTRGDIYVTQAFHLLPERRSQTISKPHLLQSFRAITAHEVQGRSPIIALGQASAALCRTCGFSLVEVPHPSARGMSIDKKAEAIAKAINAR